jgi:dethiobiotin synthetase
MNNLVFVTATGTGVGKTHSCVKLIKSLSKMGYTVGAFKPIETGVDEHGPRDAAKLLEAVQKHSRIFTDLEPKDITSYTFALPAAPQVAKGDDSIDVVKIIEDIKYFSSRCDILLIEGAGGLKVPIDEQVFMLDLMRFLDALPFLVCSSKLGGINECLLSLEQLGKKPLWAINLHEDKESFAEVSKPFYDIYFKKFYTVDEDSKKIAKKIRKRLKLPKRAD